MNMTNEDVDDYPWPDIDEGLELHLQHMANGNLGHDLPPTEEELAEAEALDKLPLALKKSSSLPKSPKRGLARAKSILESPAKRRAGVTKVDTVFPPKVSSTTSTLTTEEKRQFQSKLRLFFCKVQREKPKWRSIESRDKNHAISKLWAMITPKERADWALRWLDEDTTLGIGVKEKYMTHPILTSRSETSAEAKDRKSKYFAATAGMFSYHSALWVFKDNSAEVAKLTIIEAEKRVKESEQWKKVLSTLQKQLGDLISRVVCVQYSWSFELCPKSFEEKSQLKGHLHLVLEWPHRVYYRTANSFLVGDEAPTNLRSDSRLQKRAGNSSSHPLHFYCQIPKVGALAQSTNFAKYIDFQVNPRWISNWFHAKKLTYESAEKELYLLFPYKTNEYVGEDVGGGRFIGSRLGGC